MALLIATSCGPRHDDGGGHATGISFHLRSLSADAPPIEVTVPNGWKVHDVRRAAREGFLPFYLCLEDGTVWAGSGALPKENIGASVCIDWGPDKNYVQQGGVPIAIDAGFERAYPMPFDWQNLATRNVTWARQGAIQLHGLAGYFHEEGKLKSAGGDLGTLENLSLRDGDDRILLAGWVPAGAPANVYRTVYREMHQILLSVAPAAP